MEFQTGIMTRRKQEEKNKATRISSILPLHFKILNGVTSRGRRDRGEETAPEDPRYSGPGILEQPQSDITFQPFSLERIGARGKCPVLP